MRCSNACCGLEKAEKGNVYVETQLEEQASAATMDQSTEHHGNNLDLKICCPHDAAPTINCPLRSTWFWCATVDADVRDRIINGISDAAAKKALIIGSNS